MNKRLKTLLDERHNTQEAVHDMCGGHNSKERRNTPGRETPHLDKAVIKENHGERCDVRQGINYWYMSNLLKKSPS